MPAGPAQPPPRRPRPPAPPRRSPPPPGPARPPPPIPNSTLKLSSVPPKASSQLSAQTFLLRFSLPPRSLSEPSLPLQKLQKHSQGLTPKDLPFRALHPKFHCNSPLTSTPHTTPQPSPNCARRFCAVSPGCPDPSAGQATHSGSPPLPSPAGPGLPHRTLAASASPPHLRGSGPRFSPPTVQALCSRRPAPPWAPRD